MYVTTNPLLTCSPPFSVCAKVYRPGHYFLRFRPDGEIARPLYERLYNNGTVRLRYDIAALKPIERIQERVLLARVLMRDAECYAEDYHSTETVVLIDTLHTPGTKQMASHHTIEVEQLFKTPTEAGVQYANIVAVWKLTYTDGVHELLVKRVSVGWPSCL